MKKNIFALLALLKQESCPISQPQSYVPISRTLLPLPPALTPSEQAQVKLGVEQAQSTPALAQALQAGQTLIQAKSQIRFLPTQSEWPISGLTRHSERANLSILFHQSGTLELPESRPAGLPKILETTRWRQYCLVQDGSLHLSSLEARLTLRAWSEIQSLGMDLGPWEQGHLYSIPLSPFGLWDQEAHLLDWATLAWSVERGKAQIKAIRSLQASVDPVARLRQAYGPEAAEWLQSVGVTDSGYAPKGESKPAQSFYLAPSLQSRVKGLTIPSVASLAKKQASGKKLTRGEQVLADLLETERKAMAGKTPQEAQEILSLRRQSVESLVKVLEQRLQPILWTILVQAPPQTKQGDPRTSPDTQGWRWFTHPDPAAVGETILLPAPEGDQVEVTLREEQVKL